MFAGAHYLTEEVEKSQSLTVTESTQDATELRHAMLEADYERFFESTRTLELVIEILDEEDLYPFGADWPREPLSELLSKVYPPKLFDRGRYGIGFQVPLKKGFKELPRRYGRQHRGRETPAEHA